MFINIFSFLYPSKISSPVWPPVARRKDIHGEGYFGASRDGGKREHTGQDIKTYPGQNVYAPMSGTVQIGTYNNMYSVFVSDGNELSAQTLYMDTVTVKNGSYVFKGQKIGTAADIRPVYGAGITNHVHFSVRKNGVPVDPAKYIIIFMFFLCSVFGLNAQGFILNNETEKEIQVKIYEKDSLVKSVICKPLVKEKIDFLKPETEYNVRSYRNGKIYGDIRVKTSPDNCFIKINFVEKLPQNKSIELDPPKA